MRTKSLAVLLAAVSSVTAASLRSRKTQESRFTVCGRITCDNLHEICTFMVDANEYRCICKDDEKSFPYCGPAPTETPLDPHFFADEELHSDSLSKPEFIAPSSSPSKPWSEMPSVEPSANPSNLPSMTQSKFPSSEPSTIPSMIPSDIPSSIPSGIPSQLTTLQSDEPSSIPSAFPSEIPSLQSGDPSSIPSAFPSQVPSLEADESVVPTWIQDGTTSPPHSETCSVEVATHCTTNGGDTACDAIAPRVTQCKGPPTTLMFRYLGGSCLDQASKPQSKSLIQCLDYNGGPPAKKGWKVFITATSHQGVVHHSNYVATGSDFMMDGGITMFGQVTTVKVYVTDETTSANLLQSITFTSDCSSELTLRDNVGTMVLLLFSNLAQGVESTFVSATYSFVVRNVNPYINATMTGLTSVTSVGTYDFDEDVHGLVVAPGANVSVTRNILVDTSVSKRYSSASTATGTSQMGYNCSDMNFLSFTTSSPGSAPIEPEPIPAEDQCFVRVEATCIPTDTTVPSCDELTPVETKCTDRPFVMSFRYNGGDCSQTSLQDEQSMIACKSLNGGPPSEQGAVSYIVASDVNDASKIYHSAFVPVGSEFLVRFGTSGAPAVLNIRVYSSSKALQENMLQSVAFLSDCLHGNLHLDDTFGSFQLLVIANEAQGVLTNLVTANYSFVVENVGIYNHAILSTLTSITTLGVIDLSDSAHGVILAPNGTAQFEHKVLMDATVLQRYLALTTVTAEAPLGYTCTGMELMEYVVGTNETDSGTAGSGGSTSGSSGSSPVAPASSPNKQPTIGSPGSPSGSSGSSPVTPASSPNEQPTIGSPGSPSGSSGSSPVTPASSPNEQPTIGSAGSPSGSSGSSPVTPASSPNEQPTVESGGSPSSSSGSSNPASSPIIQPPSISEVNGTVPPSSSTNNPVPPPIFSPPDTASGLPCFLELDVECDVADGSGNCDSIHVEKIQCQGPPSNMVFRFLGGNCSSYGDESSESLGQCLDYNDGPSAKIGERSYIRVTDLDDFEVVYFESEVLVGESFMINATGGVGMKPETLILVYSSPDTSESNLLQSIVILSDCHVALSLQDYLGSIQLIGYTDSVQGTVSSLVDVVYTFTIHNIPGGSTANLTSLNSITNLGVLDVPVAGTIVVPNTTVTFTHEVAIDTSKQRRYTALSSLIGSLSDGSHCSKKDLLTFDVPADEEDTQSSSTSPAPTFAPVMVVVEGPSFIAPMNKSYTQRRKIR